MIESQYTQHGIKWQWDYFDSEDDARAFRALKQQAGYRAHPPMKVPADVIDKQIAGRWCVHWRAYSPDAGSS